MWFLFQNADVGACTGNCDAISERFSTRWLDNARAGIEEGHLMLDHVHMLISIPPEYAVSQVVEYIEGESAIHVARVYGERKRNFVGQHVWAREYFVSTVDRDERVIRAYIRHQEAEDQRLEQLNLWN